MHAVCAVWSVCELLLLLLWQLQTDCIEEQGAPEVTHLQLAHTNTDTRHRTRMHVFACTRVICCLTDCREDLLLGAPCFSTPCIKSFQIIQHQNPVTVKGFTQPHSPISAVVGSMSQNHQR